MVTIADPTTHDELSRLAEDVNEQISLEKFIDSLDLSLHKNGVMIHSVAGLPDLGTSPKALPKNAPDMFRMDWWT